MTDQELAIYIGLKIKEFRDKRGLTQKELADLIEMGNTTIANYEKGFSNIGISDDFRRVCFFCSSGSGRGSGSGKASTI